MKNSFSIVSILMLLLFTSCKKDRWCKCKITEYTPGAVFSNGTNTFTSVRVVTYENATHKRAKTLCKSYTITSDNGNTEDGECEILDNY